MRLLVVGVLLLVIAWVAWGLVGDGEASVAPVVPVANEALRPAPAVAVATSVGSEMRVEAPRIAVKAAKDERKPAWAGKELCLLVVDDATGAPVPDAEVSWIGGIANDVSDYTSEIDGVSLDVVTIAKSKGTVCLTDAEGRANVPRSTWMCIVARDGARSGWLTIHSSTGRSAEPRVIRLRPMVHLEVRLLGPDGRPRQGEELLFVYERAPTWSGLVGLGWIDLPPTDADGWSRIPDIMTRSLDATRLVGSEFEKPMLQMQKVKNMHVAWSDMAKGPIEFQLEAAGDFEFALCDAAGAPWSLPLPSLLGKVKVLDGEDPVHPDGRFFGFHLGAVFRESHVPLGRRWEVTTADGITSPFPVVGPRVAGEVVRVDVRLLPRTVVLHGRVVGPDGQPLFRPVRVYQDRRGPLPLPLPEGRFCLVLPETWNDRRPLRVECPGSKTEPALATSHEFALQPGPGVTDLGDLVLQPVPSTR